MVKSWFLAIRPWSYTASFVPITLGVLLAWLEGNFDFSLYFLTLLGGICLQIGTNLINTYGDYASGVDTPESVTSCPYLVTGVLAPNAVKTAGIAAFVAAACLGILLTYYCGWPVLAAALLGIISGYCYTAGSCPYKYQGLGVLFVFILMGPLMAWPAYFIQTGYFSWLPIVVSLPIGCLVAGILHANDIRDYIYDRQAGIKTLSINIGLQKSLLVYYCLNIAAFASLPVLVYWQMIPWTAALPILLLPIVIRVLRAAYHGVHGSAQLLSQLEARSAQLHFQFGLLMLAGILIHPYIVRWLPI